MMRVYICPDCGWMRMVSRRKNVECYKCGVQDMTLAKVDFATQKVTRISFEELQVNDKVIVSIRSSEMESFRSGGGENTIKVEQLQLYTQRAAG